MAVSRDRDKVAAGGARSCSRQRQANAINTLRLGDGGLSHERDDQTVLREPAWRDRQERLRRMAMGDPGRNMKCAKPDPQDRLVYLHSRSQNRYVTGLEVASDTPDVRRPDILRTAWEAATGGVRRGRSAPLLDAGAALQAVRRAQLDP